jgi:DNA primase
VRHAVISAARELERRMPDAVTTAWWKEERGERVFVDFNQAARDRTIAGAYSARARPDATVSTPLAWDELVPGLDTTSFTVRTVPDRLAANGDPWADFAAKRGTIGTLLTWWERDVENGQDELPYPPEHPKMPGEPTRVQPSRAKKPAEADESR